MNEGEIIPCIHISRISKGSGWISSVVPGTYVSISRIFYCFNKTFSIGLEGERGRVGGGGWEEYTRVSCARGSGDGMAGVECGCGEVFLIGQ